MNKTFWLQWFSAAFNRAVRTFFQTLAGSLSAATIFSDIDMKVVMMSALFSAVFSIVTSFASSLPEVDFPNSPIRSMIDKDETKETSTNDKR